MRSLVRRHAPGLRACALRMLDDESTADEVVQDVFTIMLRSAPGFRHDANLRTWLYAIALNRCRTLRARSRLMPDTREVDDRVADVAPDPHAVAESIERREILSRVVAGLPEDMREVIVLRYAAGRSYDEIAEIHGCAPGTVASRIHRALKRLGDELRAAGLSRENI